MSSEKDYKKIAVAIVKNPEGKYLIVKRKNKRESIDGSVLEWAFPGTAVVEDSSDETVLKDFVLKESGYNIKPSNQISSRKYHPFGLSLTYYEFELDNGEEGEKERDKILEHAWVYPDEFDNYFSTNLDSGLRDFIFG